MTSISVPALLLVLELEDLELGLPVLLPDELLEPVELLPEPVELEPVVPEFVEDPDPWEASEPVEFEPEFPPVPELVLPLVSVPLLVPDSVFVLPEPVPVEPDESVEPDELSELDDPEGAESFSVVVPLLFGVLVLSVGVCWGVDGDSVCSGEGVVTVGEIQSRTTLSVPLPWVMSSTMPAVTATANRPDTTVTITAVRLGLRRDARSSLTEYVWRERCAVGRETISRGVRRLAAGAEAVLRVVVVARVAGVEAVPRLVVVSPAAAAATMVFSGFSLAAASTRAVDRYRRSVGHPPHRRRLQEVSFQMRVRNHCYRHPIRRARRRHHPWSPRSEAFPQKPATRFGRCWWRLRTRCSWPRRQSPNLRCRSSTPTGMR